MALCEERGHTLPGASQNRGIRLPTNRRHVSPRPQAWHTWPIRSKTTTDEQRAYVAALNQYRRIRERLVAQARTYRDRLRKGGAVENCEIGWELIERDEETRLVVELKVNGRSVKDWLG